MESLDTFGLNFSVVISVSFLEIKTVSRQRSLLYHQCGGYIYDSNVIRLSFDGHSTAYHSSRGHRSHYASPRTFALVAGSSTNRLQDGGTGVESSARCSSGVFVGLLCSSGHGVRSTASTVGDCWSPDGSKGSDDNRPVELCRQRADRLEQFTSCSASTWKIIDGVQASSENILVWTLAIIDWRCCDC